MHLLAGHIYYMSGMEEKRAFGLYRTIAQNVCINFIFDIAISHFNWIEDNDPDSKFTLYVQFGHAQTIVESGYLLSDPQKRKLQNVKIRFHNDADNRDEFRSKATSRTVELVCENLLGSGTSTIDSLRSAIPDLVDTVDRTSTVYSPISKRNVTIEAFKVELDQI